MYREFFPKVYNYVYYRLLDRDRTDDLVSEVFVRVVEKIDTYDEGKAKMSTWIFRIAHNALVDEYRRRKDTASLDEEGLDVPSGDDVLFTIIKNDERRALHSALARLPGRDREIIAMKYFAGMTNRDIALELSMNESTVSSVVWNTLKKLREALRGYLGDDGDD
jgi:RNA polymerase sigma-70 factor (ECF subfamily)